VVESCPYRPPSVAGGVEEVRSLLFFLWEKLTRLVTVVSPLSLSLWMWRQLQRLGRDRPAPPLVPTTDSPFDFACV
jgi:hypothetical protein